MNKKIKDLKVGTFFKFSIRKITVDFVISIVLVYLFFSMVSWANQVFSQETFSKKLIDIGTNTVIYMILLYPLACYVALILFKKERLE
ncbi:hypothetical protein J4218_00240 [Candidatus Pacearchaeota archaeon]|nr:hypothetical protein [Candidatus Pacearchaeota archaeon]